jgi:protein-S-isoprenylcysteine O-methyltransferase Ste14
MELLAVLWLGYFAIHSALASLRVKRWVASRFPEKMPFYRMAFNGLAVLLLLPVLWQMVREPGALWWAWRGAAAWVSGALTLLALVGFAVSLQSYDSGEFLGVRQWRAGTRSVEDQEAFRLSPLHRFVRHPWYFLGLVLIWTRDMTSAMLLSAVLLTLYLVLGSWLEERKLLAYHGDAYRRYMRRVAGLVPVPWKRLSTDEAAALVADASRAAGKKSERLE